MAKYNYNLNSGLRFINPYQFVPLSGDKKRYVEGEESRSGVLHCRMLLKTPLMIPDASRKNTQSIKIDRKTVSHDSYPFMRIGEEIVVPASSLRGPIRNVYETASHSCYATMRPNQVITTRSQAEGNSTMNPGLLFCDNGEWKLYSAVAYRVSKDILGGREYGDPVRFEGTLKKGVNRKGQPYTSYEVTDQCDTGSKKGYVYIGEYFQRKSYERIFERSGTKPLTFDDRQIRPAVRQLKLLLQEYRDIFADERKRSRLPARHHAYGHIRPELFDQENTYIPIWYRQDDSVLYLSPACIGRYAYQNTLNDVLGTYDVCTDRSQTCPACSLFGMVGGKEGGRAGKVRFTDAVLIHSDHQPHMINLKELGEPHISYLPFYTKYGREYDASDIQIAGRKFYWHHRPDAAFYEAKKEEFSNMNASMEALDDGEFRFDVYYDGVTSDQLKELAWVLCLGDNDEEGSMCHKIGHAKPFGFGSVKIVIDGYEERDFRNGSYKMILGLAEELGYDRAFVDERKTPSFRALIQILDYSAIPDAVQAAVPVRYPYIESNGNDAGNANTFASHQWYGAFRSEFNKNRQMVPSLPLGEGKRSDEERINKLSLPVAVYDPDAKPDRESRHGGGSQNRGGGNRSGGYAYQQQTGRSASGGGGSVSSKIKLTEDQKKNGCQSGTVADVKPGYGFILPDGTSNRLFFLKSTCSSNTRFEDLKRGDRVIFRKGKNPNGNGRDCALDVEKT